MGDEGDAISLLGILPDRYARRPAFTACFIALAIDMGSFALAIAVLSNTPSQPSSSIIIYHISNSLFDKKTASLSALTYLTLPAVILSSTLVSTDPSLLFFWSLTLLFFVKALTTQNNYWWYASGISAGLGMLSKYSMIIFLISAITYLATNKKYKKYLTSKQLWISLAIALAIFLPNIIWNINNGLVSFLHTKDNANLNQSLFHPKEMLEFLSAQFGVFGPILFTTLIIILSKYKDWLKKDNLRLLVIFILPLLTIITLISLLSRAHANWMAPIYISATILVVHYLIQKNKIAWVYASLALHLTLGAVFLNFPTLSQKLTLTITGKQTDLKSLTIKDPFKRLKGWQELGKEATKIYDLHQNTSVLTVSRETHAELLYYSQIPHSKIIKWQFGPTIKDHYELTANIKNSTTKDFVLITKLDNVNFITKHFTKTQKIRHYRNPSIPRFYKKIPRFPSKELSKDGRCFEVERWECYKYCC